MFWDEGILTVIEIYVKHDKLIKQTKKRGSFPAKLADGGLHKLSDTPVEIGNSFAGTGIISKHSDHTLQKGLPIAGFLP